MSFILDAILIVMCIVCVAVGTKRGFVKTVMSLLSSVISAIAAYTFTPYFANFIKEKFLMESVSGGIADTIRSLVPASDGSYDLSSLFSDMPQTLSSIIERYHGNAESLEALVNSMTETGDEAVRTLSKAIAEPIVNMISTVCAFVVIFIIAFVVLKVVTCVVDGAFKLPVLKTANTLLGFVFGLILAVLFIMIYSELCATLVSALGSISPKLFGQDVVDKTLLVKFFSEHSVLNLVNKLIS